MDGHFGPGGISAGNGQKWVDLRVLEYETFQIWSLGTSTFIDDRPFWTQLNRWKISESEIISNESDEFSAAISMFCGTVITGLFELGVSHLDLEVSKFNFWSLMFDVVFLTCLSADQIYLRALNTWTKLYFKVWIFILEFFIEHLLRGNSS